MKKIEQVLVICVKGREYLYSRKSLHKVNQARAEFIRDYLNRHYYDLTGDGTAWYLMDITDFDSDDIQRRFTVRGSHGKFHLSDEYIWLKRKEGI